MTCTEFLALLDDLIDDSVTTEMRADLQEHLRGCEHCEVTLSTTRKTIETTAPTKSTMPRPPRASPRRHHGTLQKGLLIPFLQAAALPGK